ncbi:diguanylate cyclase, partial [Acidimicrobiaceae bacterium USS-CC1]|nr:diguanylate cyclase [Acidiferrimicrobium australe]
APLLAATGVALRTAARSLRRRHDATHDPLTGLANRRLFDQELAAALRSGAPEDDHVALVLVDLDGFKGINDSYGHEHGDRVLVEVAARMAAVCRPSDVV